MSRTSHFPAADWVAEIVSPSRSITTRVTSAGRNETMNAKLPSLSGSPVRSSSSTTAASTTNAATAARVMRLVIIAQKPDAMAR